MHRFRERLSYRGVKAYATMSKGIISSGNLLLFDQSSQCFSAKERETTNSCGKQTLPIIPFDIVAYAQLTLLCEIFLKTAVFAWNKRGWQVIKLIPYIGLWAIWASSPADNATIQVAQMFSKRMKVHVKPLELSTWVRFASQDWLFLEPAAM